MMFKLFFYLLIFILVGCKVEKPTEPNDCSIKVVEKVSCTDDKENSLVAYYTISYCKDTPSITNITGACEVEECLTGYRLENNICIEQVVEKPQINSKKVFEEDLLENLAQSTPSSVNFPKGISNNLNIEYLGAFRVDLAAGESNSNYAVGTLGFNPIRKSLYLAGHSHHNAIAEFLIPNTLSKTQTISDIVNAHVLQDYVTILNKKSVGNSSNKINGILYHDGSLIVSSEVWYDGTGQHMDNLQVIDDPNDLSNSSFKGMLQLQGGAKAAGFMSKIPSEWQDDFGQSYLTGWASNYSITSRYSQGPSLYTFNPTDAINLDINSNRSVSSNSFMVFPHGDNTEMVEGGDEYKLDISPMWGPSANARYGFIIPGTSIYMVLGSHAGIHSGIGYKITQDNGNVCGGACPYKATDMYNYFWLFDLNDILKAESTHEPRPFSYGKWSHTYDENGSHIVIGAVFDDESNRLYVALKEAGRLNQFDNPPLVLVYGVNSN